MSAYVLKRSTSAKNIDSEALRRAEEAMEALGDRFNIAVRQDIANARDYAANARQSGADKTAILDSIFGIVHNIKGQGGSFGYQLMTRVAASLCDYLRQRENRADTALDVIDGHLSSLQFIVDHEVKGHGGDLGERLLAKLAVLKA